MQYDKPKDECGVFGVFGHPRAVELTYLGLRALQHRGQESSGIVVSDGERFTSHHGMGLVDSVFNSDILSKTKWTYCYLDTTDIQLQVRVILKMHNL